MASLETGRLICRIRKQKSMTQKDVANYLNVSDKAVSKWERGESYPEISILPQLAGLLQITVDELLEGKLKNEPLTDEDGDEKTISYLCLLEDAQNRFFEFSIIFFLTIISGMLLSGIIFEYKIFQIAALIIGLFAIAFYCFSVSKYKTSEKRLGYFSDIKDSTFIYKILYSNVLIGTASVVLFIIVYLVSMNDYYKDGYFLTIYYINNYALPSIVVLSAINLYFYYRVYRNKKGGDLLKQNVKFLKFTAVSSLISFVSAMVLIAYKIYMIVQWEKYNASIIMNLTIALTVLAFVLNILLLILFKERKTKKYWTAIGVGMGQFLIWIFSIGKYIIPTKHYPSNVSGHVETSKLVIALLLTITIFHLTNYLAMRKESKKSG